MFVSTGSRKLFAALLDRCIARKVVPICCFTPRTNAAPSVVALIPQEERLDDSNIQILPPGFHVVYLPYSGKQVAYMLCVLLPQYHIAWEETAVREFSNLFICKKHCCSSFRGYGQFMSILFGIYFSRCTMPIGCKSL